MATKLNYRVDNNMEALVAFSELLHRERSYNELPLPVRYALDLAAEEMISNIIKYGYDDRNRHEIAVETVYGGGEVTLTLRDDGHPFDPLHDAVEADLTQDIVARPVGGVGILLTRQLTRQMRYRREGRYNVLTMVIGGK